MSILHVLLSHIIVARMKEKLCWVAECGGDISGHNQSNAFDVSVFLRGRGS